MKKNHITPGTPRVCASQNQYALHKDLGFWRVTFAGQQGAFEHEKGADYVAYLLLESPEEPIHGLDLVARLEVPDRKGSCIAELVDPVTGEVRRLEKADRIQERSLGLEDAQTMREVLRTQHRLEALLEDEEVVEPVRREAEEELIALYKYEAAGTGRTRDSAQKAAEAVSRAISRLQQHLAAAMDGAGEPDPVLRAFAGHLKNYLMAPSGRGGKRGSGRRGGLGGWFVYRPPNGMRWEGQLKPLMER